MFVLNTMTILSITCVVLLLAVFIVYKRGKWTLLRCDCHPHPNHADPSCTKCNGMGHYYVWKLPDKKNKG